ncbi:MAG: CocE/NonD family hydrolase [Planctomycetota bacterium]|nr:CocE/NonD family hydrolase [Planctomycetota bacterium]
MNPNASAEFAEHRIPMRDGTRLQAFLLLPAGAGPFPGLLARCMYGTEMVREKARKFAARGYAVVLQNVRGRLGSEGQLTGDARSPEDGYDTLEWMSRQAWCNGRIGTFGGSALASVQAATAFLAHPAHRAMCPQVLPYGLMSRLGGAFMFSQIAQWLYFSQSGAELKPYDAVDWMPHLHRLPLTSVLDELGGCVELYRERVTRIFDDYFQLDPPEAFRRLNTPNLMVTGWYDHCATGPVDFFMLTRRHGTQAQQARTHLVVGPWDHACDTTSEPHEYDFGPEANRNHLAAELDFFARHLRGDASLAPLPPARIFVMGRNAWRDEAEWPPRRTVETKFYLHSDGEARGTRRHGALSTVAPGGERPDPFVYDPAHPVPTLGGANSHPARALPMRRGPRDQRLVLYRDDVLVYASAPLAEPLEVTGMLKLVLYVSSSARDTDFTAKLMDLRPDGNARLLSDGIVRARYRNGTRKPEFLAPGEVVRCEIDLWFTSNEFQAGHRIGLAVSSSNFPRFGRNLNTGGDNERDAEFVRAEQLVYHDAARASHLLLPVIPRGGS